MKNGIPEFRKDSETLMKVYNKINAHGMTKEPLTIEEQVIIFCIAKWLGDQAEENETEQEEPFVDKLIEMCF